VNDRFLKEKGFLLFEVVISIVVIATSFLFIINSYRTAKDSIERSTEILKTSLALERKMWPYEEKGKIEQMRQSGDFLGDGQFTWLLESTAVENTGINLVQIGIYDKKHPETHLYSVSTFLEDETE